MSTQLAESLSTTIPLPSDGTSVIPLFFRISNLYNATTTISANVVLAAASTSEINLARQVIAEVILDFYMYVDSDAGIQRLVALSSLLAASNNPSGIYSLIIIFLFYKL